MREHLYRALTTPHGIKLSTDDPQGLIQKLNAERRKAEDPALKNVVIAVSRSKPESEVWLVNQTPKEESDGQETQAPD